MCFYMSVCFCLNLSFPSGKIPRTEETQPRANVCKNINALEVLPKKGPQTVSSSNFDSIRRRNLPTRSSPVEGVYLQYPLPIHTNPIVCVTNGVWTGRIPALSDPAAYGYLIFALMVHFLISNPGHDSFLMLTHRPLASGLFRGIFVFPIESFSQSTDWIHSWMNLADAHSSGFVRALSDRTGSFRGFS